MKYIVIESVKNADQFEKEFNEPSEATAYAKTIWSHLSSAEKQRTSVYVLESCNPDEDADHYDGKVILDMSK